MVVWAQTAAGPGDCCRCPASAARMWSLAGSLGEDPHSKSEVPFLLNVYGFLIIVNPKSGTVWINK